MDENNQTLISTPALPVPILCPTCHLEVKPTDYFCANCGANLHQKPLSTSMMTQFLFYIGSVVLFPLGFIWAIRYLRSIEPKAKLIGTVCLIISIGMSFVLVMITVNIVNTVNDQVGQQLQNIQGF